ALVAQHLGEAQLELGGGDLDVRLARRDGVAHAGEEIGNRVGHSRSFVSVHVTQPEPAPPPSPSGSGAGVRGHQLDLTTPGMSPRSASSRKQMRHSWNFRMYARGRPQLGQRLRCFTERAWPLTILVNLSLRSISWERRAIEIAPGPRPETACPAT